MPFSVAELLDEISVRYEKRPWGFMEELGAPNFGLTVKYLFVGDDERTSLQYHREKDELLYILCGNGAVQVGDRYVQAPGKLIRIKPGVVHRVEGHLEYLEISSYDDGTDTVRLEDDYDR